MIEFLLFSMSTLYIVITFREKMQKKNNIAFKNVLKQLLKHLFLKLLLYCTVLFAVVGSTKALQWFN